MRTHSPRQQLFIERGTIQFGSGNTTPFGQMYFVNTKNIERIEKLRDIGKSYTTIAEDLGISPTTVRRVLVIGRANQLMAQK